MNYTIENDNEDCLWAYIEEKNRVITCETKAFVEYWKFIRNSNNICLDKFEKLIGKNCYEKFKSKFEYSNRVFEKVLFNYKIYQFCISSLGKTVSRIVL